jgi:predicted RNase H-like HicB family nuclease
MKINKPVSVSVPVYFFRVRGDKYIHAQCSPLGIITSGITLEKAKAMFDEAFDLWTQTVNENGNIKETLKELGWKFTQTSVKPSEKPIDVPIELITSRMLNLPLNSL